MEQTDHELLLACRQGDESAWDELLKRYQRLVYSIPLNYGLPAIDAADIAQLTFTAFLESMHTLRDDSNLGGWLATVTRRQTWRVINERKREGLIEYVENLNATAHAGNAAYRAGPNRGRNSDSDAGTDAGTDAAVASSDNLQDSGVILWSSEHDWIDRWEKLEWIQSGLVHLQERCRRLLIYLYFDPTEPTYDEIADALEIKVGSIGPTRARCLERLKEFLQI